MQASRKSSGPAGQLVAEKDNRPRPISQPLNSDSHAAEASSQADFQIMSARSMPVSLDITELYNSSGRDGTSTELNMRSSHSAGIPSPNISFTNLACKGVQCAS